MAEKLAASFRDPSGMVFLRAGRLLRQVNRAYQADYDLLMSSGLYEKLAKRRQIVTHQEVDEAPLAPELCYKVIAPERVGFISYPYEWSFSMLKDAALLTLAIQKAALKAGMTLKDASAYNIQFSHGAPVLIDTLSFAKYEEGTPWVAYRQFCQHFLAPLALMSKVDVRLGKLSSDFIDGIPLDLASRLLPGGTRFDFGLATHIHLHARAESRYAETGDAAGAKAPAKPARISKTGLQGLIESLEGAVKKLALKVTGREWADYYAGTNYSDAAFEAKKRLVSAWVSELHPARVLDLGANTGVFSRVAAESGCEVLSTDIDPEAVEINYTQAKQAKETAILPLVVDLTNPPAAIGWDNRERESFFARAGSDVVLALALVHHLAIANNVSLDDIARSFAALGEHLIIEFVPKDDSQVQRLLRSRDDIFSEYTLDGMKRAFAQFYELVREAPVEGSRRTMLLFKRR